MPRNEIGLSGGALDGDERRGAEHHRKGQSELWAVRVIVPEGVRLGPQIAESTYRAAVKRWPRAVITLRQGARVIYDSRRQ
jgi:hypothetical protein